MKQARKTISWILIIKPSTEKIFEDDFRIYSLHLD